MTRASRSSSEDDSAELRLPRPPGVIRRFWARHPRFADVLIALLCVVFSFPPMFGYNPDSNWAAWDAARPVVIVVVLCAAALAIVRRRWPFAFYGGTLAATIAYLFTPGGSAGILLPTAIYAVAVYRSSRAAWIALGSALLVTSAVAAPLVWSSVITIQVALNVLLGSAVSGLIGALIGVNVGNRKRYLEALLDRSRQLWVEREQHARLAAAAERTRIAREMHDIVSHSLTVIVALAEGATATDARERSREATSLVASTARAALGEMRGMLGVLRDESAADVPLSPVDEDTIPAAVEAARAAGAPVRLAVTGRPTGSRPVRLALARVVQEGLTNVLRHAPGARSVEVDLVYAGDGVQLSIQNDGVPAASAPSGRPGYGLRGIRERVDHVGGNFHAGSDRPGWWRLDVRIPLELKEEPA